MPKEHFEKAGLFELAPCSVTMGMELIELDMQKATTRVKFEGKPEFCNPFGTVQGGFLSAMLDDAIGMLATLKLAGKGFPSTIDLTIQYLRPIKVGKVEVAARITGIGRNTMFGEAELFDARGKLACRAISSMAIMGKQKLEN